MYALSTATAFDALIVGRGAIGAAAALGLSRLGLKVAIVARPSQQSENGQPAAAAERAAQSDWDSRVFALSPATRSLLQQLRVWGALDASRVAPVFDMLVFPSSRPGAPELHFSAYESRVEALAWIVENRILTAALDRALGFANVAIIDGVVSAFQLQPQGASVTLQDGRQLHARLLVGADGAESVLRELAGLQTTVRDYPQTAVVANFDSSQPHRDCAWQWFGDHGVLALLPLPGDRCSIVWSAPSALAQTLVDLDPQVLAERVSELSGARLGRLQMITAARTFPLRRLQVERLIAPRLVLIGDAAHVVHPLAGQGMNLGFGDLQCLLDVIQAREPFRDPGDPMLLRRYERARREPVAMMRMATDGLQRLFDPESESALPALLRPILAGRELGWRLVESSSWLKRRLVAHAAS
jgi:2-octaprenylphenol hydroxylase